MRLAGAVALSLVLIAAQHTDRGTAYITVGGTKCYPAGTAESAKMKALNRLKNREVAPDEDEIDPEVSLAAILAPGQDDRRFDPHKGAQLTAFVVDVKSGGKETCNCDETNPTDIDTHIEVSLAPGAAPTERVIVEVTPRIRKQMGPLWTTEALAESFKGKWVRITGWMLFDFVHAHQAENTNPGGDGNWRATCWEVHPVTSIETVPAPEGAADIRPEAIQALRSAHRRHVPAGSEDKGGDQEAKRRVS